MSFRIEVSISKQTLTVYDQETIIKQYSVSTAKNGPGELMGSECTPRGQHYVRAKIGEGCANNSVFVGRRATGEIFTSALKTKHPNRDWILTRILWLCGKEPGKNRFGKFDTQRRYIYIHGCPDEDVMGIPSSHGCIKMRNQDVIELFDLIPNQTIVNIIE
ncbi:MAG: L,D-transpeptidase [Gammaproteobacteria bacterium]|nr:L,D-transpeptidase [Gammaproteobacteria bacterium]MDH5731014.1 L,D-transpeptidase [Gammaproteobacteria bacterium]